MPAEHAPVRADKIAGGKGPLQAPLDKGGIVTVRDKADVLAVRPVCVEKAVAAGELAGLLFGHLPQGEERMGELFLRQGVEHIALVLRKVPGFLQNPAVPVPADAGIVPRRNGIAAEKPGPLVQAVKLQPAVAFDAGVRRLPFRITAYKRLDHVFFKGIRKVEDIIRHAETEGNAACILDRVQAAAGLFIRSRQIAV